MTVWVGGDSRCCGNEGCKCGCEKSAAKKEGNLIFYEFGSKN